MKCLQCRNVFAAMGDALNAQVSTDVFLQTTTEVITKQLGLKSCHVRLLSRDQSVLEHVASYGLSDEFLTKGPVDAERSVSEALKGEVVLVEDCSLDPRIQFPGEHAREGIVSLLTVPLESRGQVIGVMRFGTAERRKFTPEEIDFFKVVTVFCTSAIIHSMFHQILENVNEAIRASMDLQDVLDGIVRVIAENLRTRGCSIRLVSGKAETLEMRASYGLSDRFLRNASGNPGQGVAMAMKGEYQAIVDASTDPRIRNKREIALEKIASVLFVPLVCRHTAMGVLSVYTNKPYTFSEDEIQMMTSIAAQCALSIRNAQMYEALKKRYNTVVDDFQQWFEHYCVYPGTHTQRIGS
jgi:GAF domain-containing protein